MNRKVIVMSKDGIIHWSSQKQFCGGIVTSVDLDEPVQPPFKLRHFKCGSVCSVTVIDYGSDQTAGTYHIVGNLMSRLNYVDIR